MINLAGCIYFLAHGMAVCAPYLILAAIAAGVAAYCMRPVYVRTDDVEKNKEMNQKDEN
jgi:hypothetical protein